MRLDELKVCPSLHGIKLNEWTNPMTDISFTSALMNVDLNDAMGESESNQDEDSIADEDVLIPMDEGGFGADDIEGDFDAETNISYNGESETALSFDHKVARHSFVLSTDNHNKEFSYFDKAFRTHWSGAEHWKLGTHIHSKCWQKTFGRITMMDILMINTLIRQYFSK